MRVRKAMKQVKDNRGVTLVELIVSIAVFGMVAAAAITMIVFASKVSSDISVDTIENTKIVSTFDLVKTQIRQSGEVTVVIGADGQPEIKLENGAVYSVIEGKFVYIAQGQGSGLVLFDGVDSMTVPSIKNPSPNTEYVVSYLLIDFVFENGDSRQLVASCRN